MHTKNQQPIHIEIFFLAEGCEKGLVEYNIFEHQATLDSHRHRLATVCRNPYFYNANTHINYAKHKRTLTAL